MSSSDSFMMITYTDTNHPIYDTCQFTDGYAYVLTEDMMTLNTRRIYQISANVNKLINPVAPSSFTDMIVPLYMTDNNNGNGNLISFFQYIDNSFVGITDTGVILQRKHDISTTNGFNDMSYIVQQGVGMGNPVTSTIYAIRMDYFSNGMLVCVGSDNRLYTKQTLSSYTVKAPHNDYIIIDVCVTRSDDKLYAVTSSGTILTRTLSGYDSVINGTWVAGDSSTCCCLALSSFS